MKALTITSAITAAIVGGITTWLTPWVVLWIAIVIGLGLCGTLLGWGHTEAVKRLLVLPPDDYLLDGRPITQREYWSTEQGKRRIYAWAIATTFVWTELCGIVFLLVTSSATADGRQWLVVITVLWFIFSALIAFSSPWTYRWTIKHMLPRINRLVDADDPPPAGDDRTLFVRRDKKP